MRVRYTATAARELSNAIDYLAQHAPSVVEDFADAVERGVGKLQHFRSPPRKRACGASTSDAFTIAFSIQWKNDKIVVLHIRHAAQRLPWEEE
jgi:plasmid stabilization system protein ParE